MPLKELIRIFAPSKRNKSMNKNKIYVVGKRNTDADKKELQLAVNHFNKNGYITINPVEIENNLRDFLTIDNLDQFENNLLTELTTKILTDKEITTVAVLTSWTSCYKSRCEIFAAQLRGLKIIHADTEKPFEYLIVIKAELIRQ